MGTGIYVKVSGDKALRKKLAELSASAQRKVVRPAANKAMTPMNKAAKRYCPKETGTLRKSLGKKVKSYPARGVVWVGIAPRAGPEFEGIGPDGRKRVPVKYYHLVEFGTSHSPARSFMRRAFDATHGQIERILGDEVWRRMARGV